jgi:hypothetical protein
MINKYLIGSLLVILGCSSLEINENQSIITVEHDNKVLEFNHSDFKRYKRDNVIEFEGDFNSRRLESIWIRCDWYLSFVVNFTNKGFRDSYFFHSNIEALQASNYLASEDVKDTLNMLCDFSYGKFCIDTTLDSYENKVGKMAYILGHKNMVIVLQIYKYHYKDSDKPEFQNILKRFTITEKN